MNTLSRLLGLLLLLSILSCESNPPEPGPDHIDPPLEEAEFEFVYKFVQQHFIEFYEESWELTPLSRMGSTEYFSYSSAFPAELGDPFWSLGFGDNLQDINILESFGEASGRFYAAQCPDIISKEYLIAPWGNALDAYNLYRRTGLPRNMQPAISPAPGSFPRTLLYPSVHVNRNENVSQKTFSIPVFWDTNDGSIFNR